jgi:hypothetical protein
MHDLMHFEKVEDKEYQRHNKHDVNESACIVCKETNPPKDQKYDRDRE